MSSWAAAALALGALVAGVATARAGEVECCSYVVSETEADGPQTARRVTFRSGARPADAVARVTRGAVVIRDARAATTAPGCSARSRAEVVCRDMARAVDYRHQGTIGPDGRRRASGPSWRSSLFRAAVDAFRRPLRRRWGRHARRQARRATVRGLVGTTWGDGRDLACRLAALGPTFDDSCCDSRQMQLVLRRRRGPAARYLGLADSGRRSGHNDGLIRMLACGATSVLGRISVRSAAGANCCRWREYVRLEREPRRGQRRQRARVAPRPRVTRFRRAAGTPETPARLRPASWG